MSDSVTISKERHEELIEKERRIKLLDSTQQATELAKENGFNGKGVTKQLAKALCKAGGISEETKKDFIRGINNRNCNIAHRKSESGKKITQANVAHFNKELNKIKTVIEEGFVTEF